MSGTNGAVLDERAAELDVRVLDGSRYEVESATEPGRWHVVFAPREASTAAWVCDCRGGRGYCSHKRAVARRAAASDGRDEARAVPEVIRWRGAIADRPTAVQASGAIEGGGRVWIDVPDSYASALSALIAVRRRELEITVKVVT